MYFKIQFLRSVALIRIVKLHLNRYFLGIIIQKLMFLNIEIKTFLTTPFAEDVKWSFGWLHIGDKDFVQTITIFFIKSDNFALKRIDYSIRYSINRIKH